MKNKYSYFDIAATTPIDNQVIDLMHEINNNYFGNPSSVHAVGQKSHNLVEKSRIKIAEILNCKSSEIFFTSGGSESNNIVLKGLLAKGDHLITSSYEHPSILGLAKTLIKNDIEVTFVKPSKNGIISLNDIKNEIKKNTKLISIMYVNNELGTINPIEEIANLSKENKILFHSDAVQYIGKEKINLLESNIDFLSIGAHKFYGPKGIGILYMKSIHTVNPLIAGGGQESGIRAGTENISYIAGMSLALTLANDNYKKNKEYILSLENYFMKQLDQSEIDYRINGKNRIPGIMNITFFNIDGQALLMNLDLMNIAISYGSACSSGSVSAPQALLEIGMEESEAQSSVRISFGKMNNKDNIDYLISSLKTIIARLKK
tara:strand:+ start:236 stop:1363 length:1128 start_codon:yes stop_codon:yes gene_type:complete